MDYQYFLEDLIQHTPNNVFAVPALPFPSALRSILYPDRSQETISFFSKGVIPEKLLIVPVDFAKSDHLVHFCRGTGEFLLNQPISIYNTVKGAEYLEKRIFGICRKYHISKDHILIGGEDPPNYAFNFIHHLKSLTNADGYIG